MCLGSGQRVRDPFPTPGWKAVLGPIARMPAELLWMVSSAWLQSVLGFYSSLSIGLVSAYVHFMSRGTGEEVREET